jgi:UDP-N-acetylmuramoyl-L-alanyl-D-glutamate--2,6-diaminopimelate ligase
LALKEFINVPGRFEKFKLLKNSYAIIDYAHSPDAFENIFKNISIINKNRKIITVFGCGGERDKYKRPKMAKIAEQYSELTIVTNDNPRNEDEDLIINDIVKGFSKNQYRIIKDRKEAILESLKNTQNNILLILGKGIEEYQNIKNEKIPHSDINIVKEYIDANRN